MAAHQDVPPAIARSLRVYRGLMVAYPRDFRVEHGDDLVQAFGDLLLFGPQQRGITWWRVIRDLATSAVVEHGRSMKGGMEPRTSVAVLAIAVVGAVLLGPSARFAVPGFLVLIVLPVFSISRFRRAWVVRRSTGAEVAGTMALGGAGLIPAVVFLIAMGDDAGWWIFMTIALFAVVGAAVGLVWGVVTLLTARRRADLGSRRRRAVLVMAPAVLVLAFVIGASYNSYRTSLGPAGDHSVANASADTRALWEAADRGDVDEVRRLSATCADPWVKFPVEDGRHNAKGWVEEKSYGLSDQLKAPYQEIRDVLRETMKTWSDRCGGSTEP